MKRLFSLLLIAIASQPFGANSQTREALHILATYPVSGNGSWDYLSLQPHSNQLFISHGNEVNIIDKNNGDSLGCVKGLNGVHGIAYVPQLNKGYITSGRDNAVVVIDLTTHAILKKINGGQNPDAITYDTRLHKLIVSNGKSKDLSLIDPETDLVTSTIALDGKPEVALSDGKNIYVNLEDKSEIAVVDIQSAKVIKRWSLAPFEAPTGMVIDLKNHLLFTACSNSKKLVIINFLTGKILNSLPIGEDCDGLWFDPELKRIYASNREGTVTVIKQIAPQSFKVLANVVTKPGARTITGDAASHKIYVSAADTKKQNGNERPSIVPGSFTVTVLGY